MSRVKSPVIAAVAIAVMAGLGRQRRRGPGEQAKMNGHRQTPERNAFEVKDLSSSALRLGRRRKRIGRRALAGAVLASAVFGAGAVAFASIPSSDGAIYACYSTNSGALRVVDEGTSCRRGEAALSWSSNGEPLASLTQLAGLACTTANGEGTTHVSVAETWSPIPTGGGAGVEAYGVTTTCRVPWAAVDGTPCDDGDTRTDQDAYNNGVCRGIISGICIPENHPYTTSYWDGNGCVVTNVNYDGDQDGFHSTAPVGGSPDCDDTNPAIHPDAVEVANGIDDNCNGVIDET